MIKRYILTKRMKKVISNNPKNILKCNKCKKILEDNIEIISSRQMRKTLDRVKLYHIECYEGMFI